MTSWERVERLDAGRMIAAVNAETGAGLRFDGYCSELPSLRNF